MSSREVDPVTRLGPFLTLADLVAAAVVPPAPTDLLTSITAVTRLLFGARSCSLAVITPDGDELDYVAADGQAAAAVVGLRLALGRGIAGWVAASGQPLFVLDVQEDPRFARDIAESIGYVPTTLLAVPVMDDDLPLGVLSVLDPSPSDDPELMARAEELSRHAALTLVQHRRSHAVGELVLEALRIALRDGAETEASSSTDELVRAFGELLDSSADRDSVRLAGVAELLQRLSSMGDAEIQLALDLLHDGITYAEAIRVRR